MKKPALHTLVFPLAISALILLAPLRSNAAGPAEKGTAATQADDPSANRVDEAPTYTPNPPAGNSERAAQRLNERDDRNTKIRKEKGDRTLENAEKVTRESEPESPNPANQP